MGSVVRNRTFISREIASQEIPEEFSARLPVAIFLHLTQDLEAVLYTDYFCDRRSSLLIRLLVDTSLGMNLTDEYIAEVLFSTIEKQNDSTEVLAEKLLPSLLELDVILKRNYTWSFESYLFEELDVLFAQLPLKCTEIQLLPRPPIYLSSTATDPTCRETAILLRIHNLLCLLLTSLHITNRLHEDLRRTINVFAEPEAKMSGGKTILTRVAVVVLSLIYRDVFSLAEEEKWKELPEIAMKYKALIEGEDEQNSVLRWHSLAGAQDVDHANLFFEFIKNTFYPQNNLPPLDNSTRELWMEQIYHAGEEDHTGRDTADWVSGLLLINRTVPSVIYEQMVFISKHWKGISFPDPTLIPLRLYVSPDILCRQLPSSQRLLKSAREVIESNRSAREDSLFAPRSQILEEYTLRAKEDLARRKIKNRRRAETQREPKYMRGTVNSLYIQKIVDTQEDLRKTVTAERDFLKSSTRNSLSSYSSSSLSPSNSRDDAIRRDIQKLNKKIEVIGKMLEKTRVEEILERTESVASSIPPLPDNYNEIPAVEQPPMVEKLDLSGLSPTPRAVKPMTLEEEENEDEEDEISSQLSMSTAKTWEKNPSSSNTRRILIRPQSDRLPLLHYNRTKGPPSSTTLVVVQPQIATTERGIQTSSMTLGEMKPMSRQDISSLYRSLQT